MNGCSCCEKKLATWILSIINVNTYMTLFFIYLFDAALYFIVPLSCGHCLLYS